MDSFYSPDAFAPSNSIGYLLRRANKLSMARAEAAFEDSEITFTQWIVLALTFSGTARTCAELSRNIGHNSGAMTRVVDQLEERGLLARTPDEADRRVTRLAITEAGRGTVTDLAARVIGLWNDILHDFDREEVVGLIATLTRLVARLEAVEDQAGR